MAELPPGSANGHELQVMRNNDSQGRSQDFYIRGTEAERQSRENRGADAVGIGEGPPTHLWNIWGPQNTSGRENSVTLASFFP